MTRHEPNDQRRLQAEIRSPNFFAMTNGKTAEPIFIQEVRIQQLLRSEHSAAFVLEAMANSYFAAADKRGQQAEQEQHSAIGLLRLMKLVENVTEPKVRAMALSLFTAWIADRNVAYAKQGNNAAQPYDEKIIQAHADIIDQLATFPAEQSTPQNCATLIDAMANGVVKDGATEPARWSATATILYVGRIVRERCAEQYLGPASTNLERAEYGIDAASKAKTSTGLAALINSTRVQPLYGSHEVNYPFVSALKKQGPKSPSGRHYEFSAAMFSNDPAQKTIAVRMLRKELLLGDPLHTLLEVINLVAQAIRLPNVSLRNLGQIAQREAVTRPYLAELELIIKDILGDAGITALHQLLADLQYYSSSIQAFGKLFEVTSNVKPEPNVKLVGLPRPPKKPLEYRAVSTWDNASLPPDRLRSPLELPETTQRALKEYAMALVADIREATVAIGETSTTVDLGNDQIPWTVLSKASTSRPFPARTIRLIGQTDMIELALNEKLEFEPPLKTELSSGDTQLLQLARSYVIAALHDQLSYSNVTTIEAAVDAAVVVTDQVRKPRPRPASTKKPQRVRRLKNLVVVNRAEVDAHTTLAIQTNPEKLGEDILLVDRKPHWADMAPQLTVEARMHVLVDLENEGLFTSCTREQIDLMKTALIGPEAHLMSGRRILQDLSCRRKGDGTPVLPNELPLNDIIARFTTGAEIDDATNVAPNTEESYYQQLLTTYAGEDINFAETGPLPAEKLVGIKKEHKPAGRLPAILPIIRHDSASGEDKIYRPSIGQRLEADKAAMAEAGVDYQIPDRRLPTQTYVPYHRMAAIPITERVTRKKNYTVIRAESAVAALTTLLQTPAQAK
ncbi:MAG: hypothetical protein ACD_43C00240G0005 [uncultured bacterium]|nr:MAG: hypothetical protein ACD_43C00240G0005 [uncultured bacterium]